MDTANITEEQREAVNRFIFYFDMLNEKDLIVDVIGYLSEKIPNNYDFGTILRTIIDEQRKKYGKDKIY
jgi:hypothetical protein